MELKWLEDFVAITETHSFSRAAEARHVTQSAFSRRIKQLESWCGASLVNRATMPVQLTPAGRKFLPVARDIMRDIYASREMLQPAAKRGMLRLAALHTLTVAFFPGWIRRMETQIHGLNTVIIPDRGGIEANLAALIDGESDFFLTYAHPDVPLHLDTYHFGHLVVGSDRLIPVCAPLLRMKDASVSGADILDRASEQQSTVPYLGYGFSSFFGVALQRLFAKHPPPPRRMAHENTISAGLKELALTGMGMCWLPESLIKNELETGSLVFASQDHRWFLDLEIRLYRALNQCTAATDEFWETARTQFIQENG